MTMPHPGEFVATFGLVTDAEPGSLQGEPLDHPNLLASAYPLVKTPPGWCLSSILHGLCLWKLRRMTRHDTAGVPSGVVVQAP